MTTDEEIIWQVRRIGQVIWCVHTRRALAGADQAPKLNFWRLIVSKSSLSPHFPWPALISRFSRTEVFFDYFPASRLAGSVTVPGAAIAARAAASR